jgi:acyl-CoA synthetase (NDP forming)
VRGTVETRDHLNQIDALFHPRSVAIVGVPRGMKTGKLFLIAFQEMGFPGAIYPVHPQAENIDGLKAYPSVSAIPGPVDLAIVLVPHDRAYAVVKECAEKGVRGIVLFTAGYRETGTAEGEGQEAELVRVARSRGTRIIGPNCMGLYCPRTGLSFFPGVSKIPGHVGLISHSGSLANILARMGARHGIYFSKAVSVGNESDLTVADFVEYLGEDQDTQVIAAYLEGIKHGPRLLEALKGVCRKKPVIVWKMGLTSEGGRAAASHTGSLTGSREVWEGVVRQTGTVPVRGFEAWVDLLMGFSLLPRNLGDGVAIISGPGGLAVSAAEACGRAGLRLAELTDETRSALAEFVPPTGTSCANPIDVGLSASLQIDIYRRAAQTAAADPGVDAVVVIGRGIDPETNRQYLEAMIETHGQSNKPLLMVNIPGSDTELGLRFAEADVPFFATSERAMTTYAGVRRYQLWRGFGRMGLDGESEARL